MGSWVRAHNMTHDPDGRRIEWPDGECYADQTLIQVQVWEFIADELAVIRKSSRKGRGNG